MHFPLITTRTWATITFLVILNGCSDEPSVATLPTDPSQQTAPDPGEAIQKRIEGKTEEALAILRDLNAQNPGSAEILTLLGRTLLDAEEYHLAAFRLEQAWEIDGVPETLGEAAQAYELAGDDDSSAKLYNKYLQKKPEDTFAYVKYARILYRLGKENEALEAFQRAPEKANAEDSLSLAQLFLAKGIYNQAQHWFLTAEKKNPKQNPATYLGLIEVAIKLKQENEIESYALALEKVHPGALEKSTRNNHVAELLARRRGLDFFRRGIPTEGKNASELAAALLAPTEETGSVVATSKLPPENDSASNPDQTPSQQVTLIPAIDTETNAPLNTTPNQSTSLADFFSSPQEQSQPTERSFLEEAELSMVEKKYRSALLFTRKAIRQDAQNASAWHLASQAHFLLGENEEAEMKALEATRHAPDDLGYHMDYLRIARETLEGREYLEELEKAHEKFPQSIEILWQLARRYHVAENKPVTAAVLYRKLLANAPPDNPLRPEAERELKALGELP